MTCKYCGTPLPADAMFCGECGRSVVVTAARIAATSRSSAPPAVEPPAVFLAITDPPVPAPQVEIDVEPAVGPEAEPEPEPEPAPEPAAANDTAVIEPLLREIEFPVAQPESAVESEPAGAGEPELHDIEATRIVRSGVAGARFVLQFSTGESHAVFGTGLIGRNPVAEPGEYFDVRIAISDPGKSVSKTHLEFGQSDGQFWILDRFSGNGTVVRQPDASAIRCDGGKRYIVPRGARIDLGEQFLVVS